MLHRLRARLRSLWRWRRQESDLAQEIQFHLSEEADERVAAGCSPDQARLAARRDFGNVASVRARTRDVWVWPWLQDLGQDVRFACRLLARDRWFTLAVRLPVGFAGAFVVGKVLEGALLRTSPSDPATLASIIALLLGVTLTACVVPARRAAHAGVRAGYSGNAKMNKLLPSLGFIPVRRLSTPVFNERPVLTAIYCVPSTA